jgi:hypothetical protein
MTPSTPKDLSVEAPSGASSATLVRQEEANGRARLLLDLSKPTHPGPGSVWGSAGSSSSVMDGSFEHFLGTYYWFSVHSTRQERRRGSRVHLSPGQVRVRSEREGWEGDVVNISVGGARLRPDHALELDEHDRVLIELVSSTGEHVSLGATFLGEVDGDLRFEFRGMSVAARVDLSSMVMGLVFDSLRH